MVIDQDKVTELGARLSTPPRRARQRLVNPRSRWVSDAAEEVDALCPS